MFLFDNLKFLCTRSLINPVERYESLNGVLDYTKCYLTDLSFLEEGSDWVPPTQLGRLAGYENAKMYYDNLYDGVITKEIVKRIGESEAYDKKGNFRLSIVKTGYYQMVVGAFKDLCLGSNPKFTSDDAQEQLDELIYNNDFYTREKTALIDLIRYSIALFKIYMVDGQVKIEVVSPRYWYPVVNPLNMKEIICHVLAVPSQDGKLLNVEVHEKGKITTFQRVLNGGKLGQYTNEPITLATGLDDFAIVPMGLSEDSEELVGTSSFADYNNIVTVIETELSLIEYRLSKVGICMYGSERALQRNQKSGEWEFKSNNYIALSRDDVAPGYLEIKAQVQESLDVINSLQKQLYRASGTSPAMFSEFEGNAPSGEALRRLMSMPLAKSNDLVGYLQDGTEYVLKLALQWQYDFNSDIDITSKYYNEIEDSESEKTEMLDSRVMAGTLSKLSAIMRLDECTEEQAQEELERINAERESDSTISLEDIYPKDEESNG